MIGLGLEHFVIRHSASYRPFETLLLTWGFFLITTEIIKIVFGTDLRTVENPLPGAIVLGTVVLPAYKSMVAVISLLILVGLALLLFQTTLGIKIRALVQNAEAASLLGLNIGRTYKMVFVAGAFIAGLAGALISPMLSVDPYIGNIFLVRSFFVVIVGGIGQVLGGTLIGSFLIGGSETLFALFSGQVVAQTIVFALAIVCSAIQTGRGPADTMSEERAATSARDEVAGERPALFRDDRRRRHLCPARRAAGLRLRLFDLHPSAIPALRNGPAMSLGILWGFTGILSFGQAAFFALGAYAMGLAAKWGFGGTWLTQPLSRA